MQQYLSLVSDILEKGYPKNDRTGTGTYSIFGYQMRFDLLKGFPLITTKKVHLKSIVYELLWFLNGKTNNTYLKKNGVSIWNGWADKDGNLGPIYGKQWRNWNGIDQIKNVIRGIKENPNSRRLIVNSWNVSDLPDEKLSPIENVKRGRMALAPCHTLFQFYVQDKKLSCQLYQRSADVFLGLPFNIASYALLTMMFAQVCGLACGDLVYTLGDVHLYKNHIEQAKLQLLRLPYKLPTMQLNEEKLSISDFVYEDFRLLNYRHHPHIKAPVAI